MRIVPALGLILLAGTAAARSEPTAVPTPLERTLQIDAVQPGMSVADAIRHLGRDPDHSSVVGAACGMLEVLAWDDLATRLVAVDGTISSVARESAPRND